MAKGNRRTWAPVPRALLSDQKYLRLNSTAREMLVRLYLVADSDGRFGAEPALLVSSTCILRASNSALSALAASGFVHVYDTDEGRVGEITAWHENITSRMRSTFGEPEWPAPGVVTPPVTPPVTSPVTVRASGGAGVHPKTEIESEKPPTGARNAHARESETQPLAPRTSPGDTWQPISPPPPPQQPTPPDGGTTEQPATEPPPPLCERGRAVVADFERRMLANPFGEGMLHPRGFFGDGGPMDLEHRLRVLQRDNWEAYDTACRAFWAEVSKTRNNNWWPRDPVRELNSWLTKKGHTVSPALSLMRAAVGGRDGRA